MGQKELSSSCENMKAQFTLCILFFLVGTIASHSLSKRSLLRQQHSQSGHHQHHQQQHHRRVGGGRRKNRRFGARRNGRDGGGHHEDGGHGHHGGDHDAPARAISTGYLPAAYDYEDDLAGYGAAGTRSNDYNDLPGYGGDQRDLAQYDETTTAVPEYDDTTEASGDSADDQYG